MDDYRCPNCDALRDSPTAMCDRCDYHPDPIEDQEPPEASARSSIAASVINSLGTAAGIALGLTLAAIACAGLVIDNRIADRAIADLESHAAAWLDSVIP